jgi:uncharacterized protein YfaT (DUF1175 family)
MILRSILICTATCSATTTSERQWMLTDCCSQVRHAAALAVHTASWLWDEDANASESNMGDALA